MPTWYLAGTERYRGPVFPVAGGGGPAQTLDPGTTTVHVSLDGTNLIATGGAGATSTDGSKGLTVWTSGLHYFEVTVTALGGGGGGGGICVFSPTFALGTTAIGGDTQGYLVFTTDGGIYLNNATSDSIGAITAGHVVCVAIDVTHKKVWFRKDGGTWSGGGTADPTDSSGGASWSGFGGSGIYPGVACFENGTIMTANFGPTFTFTAPVGYS